MLHHPAPSSLLLPLNTRKQRKVEALLCTTRDSLNETMLFSLVHKEQSVPTLTPIDVLVCSYSRTLAQLPGAVNQDSYCWQEEAFRVFVEAAAVETAVNNDSFRE